MGVGDGVEEQSLPSSSAALSCPRLSFHLENPEIQFQAEVCQLPTQCFASILYSLAPVQPTTEPTTFSLKLAMNYY